MKIDSVMCPNNFEYDPEVLDLSKKDESYAISENSESVTKYFTFESSMRNPVTGIWEFQGLPSKLNPSLQHTNLLQLQTLPRLYSPITSEAGKDIVPESHRAGILTKSSSIGLPSVQTDVVSPFDIIRNAAVLQQQIMKQLSPCPQSELLVNIESNPKNRASLQPTVSPDSTSIHPGIIKGDAKISRPFKAYPRDPITLAATFTATDALLDADKAEKYRVFRKRMLEQMHASNGGRPTVTNPKMRRNIPPKNGLQGEQANDSSASGNEASNPDPGNICNEMMINGSMRDAAYYERRKKNNAAAKKSRDRRRIKEDEIAVRAAFLESENIELRIQLAALKNQLAMIKSTAKG